MIDRPEVLEDEATPGEQQPQGRFCSEVRLRCAEWPQVQALCTEISEGSTVVVPLKGAGGYVTVTLELPDGGRVSLRAHLSGTMLGADGTPTGLLLQPRPTYTMRSELQAAARRAVGPHADSAGMETLANQASWKPRTSGISPRGAGTAVVSSRPAPPADPSAGVDDPASDHPTVPPPRKKP